MESVLEEHPSIKIAQQDIIVAQALAKKHKAKLFPTLDLEVGAAASQNEDGTKGFDNDYTALVNFRYDLYKGGEDFTTYREHLKRLEEAKEKQRQTQLDIEQNLYQTWARFQNEHERTQNFKEQVQASKETWDAYQNQFNIGLRTLLDLLDSENELFNARSNHIKAQFDQIIFAYQLKADQGKLLKTLKIEAPKSAMLP